MALGSELKDVKPSCSNVKPGSCRLSRVSKPRARGWIGFVSQEKLMGEVRFLSISHFRAT